jgi:hypothetical protein
LVEVLIDKLEFDFSNISKQREIFSAKEKRFSKGKRYECK